MTPMSYPKRKPPDGTASDDRNAGSTRNSPKATKVARRIALKFVGTGGATFVTVPFVDMLDVSLLPVSTMRRTNRLADDEGG